MFLSRSRAKPQAKARDEKSQPPGDLAADSLVTAQRAQLALHARSMVLLVLSVSASPPSEGKNKDKKDEKGSGFAEIAQRLLAQPDAGRPDYTVVLSFTTTEGKAGLGR